MKIAPIFLLLICQNLLAQKVILPEQIANPIQLPKIENVSCSDCKSLKFLLVDSAGEEKLWRRIEYFENGKSKTEIVRHRNSNSFDTIKFHYDESEREILREIVDTLGNVVLRYELIKNIDISSEEKGIRFDFTMERNETKNLGEHATPDVVFFNSPIFKDISGDFSFEYGKLKAFSKLGFHHKYRYDSENRLKSMKLISKKKEGSIVNLGIECNS
jgi:hypothetical protein